MALRDLISWGREQPSVPSRRGEEVSPFLTLHREMNRLFDDVFNNFGNTPSLLGRMPAWPSIEVVQSEKGRFERVIPLPFAVEEDKAEASFNNGVLTVTLPRSAKAEDKAKRIAIGCKSEDTKH